MATAQTIANRRAWEDGYRCGKKGLGVTSSGRYDYEKMSRLFNRGYRAFSLGIDKEEAFEEWMCGWYLAEDEREAGKVGQYMCGRPI